jgi:hypothetical protein
LKNSFQEKGFKGYNKVLYGEYLAENISPVEISEIITIIKNNIIKNTSSI